VVGFLKSAKQGDFERALQYLDTKKTDRAAQKLIHELQVVLDRGSSGKLAMLSKRPEGSLEDNLPPAKERVGTIDTPSGSVDILLERTRRGDGPPIWLFPSETLVKIPGIYEDLDDSPKNTYVPKILVDTWFLWFPLWQWIVIFFVIPFSFVVAILLTRLLNLLVLHLMRRILGVRGDRHAVKLTGPFRLLILSLMLWVLAFYSRSILSSLFWTYVASTLTVTGLTWLCIRLTDMILKLKQRQWAVTSTGKVSMVQLVRKLSKVLVVIIGAIVVLYIAGINVTAALTGLGIGGLAIAFAAQKTLENLFGGIMIISDQPIRVGDFIRAGAYLGTVEEIGLRSTYIRVLDRTLVSIPNGQLALLSLENLSRRDKMLFSHAINLRYETTPDQLRYVLAETKRLFSEHPQVEQSTAHASFLKCADSSLVIDVFAYILENNYDAFLDIQEAFLFRIMEIIETSGTQMAFPSRTTYIAKDTLAVNKNSVDLCSAIEGDAGSATESGSSGVRR
jgi:MscS family membrane protein